MWEDLSNWNEYAKILVGLFAMVAPPIVIPPYLTISTGRTLKEKKQTILVGVIGFIIILMLFTFFGSTLLDAFGISMAAFRMAGGLVLMLLALELLRAEPPDKVSDTAPKSKSSPAALGVVPLAIPFLAGPGAISTVVLFSNNQDSLAHKLVICATVLVLALYLFVSLRLVAASEKLIGPGTTLIISKIGGLVLCAIAFEFLFHGIAEHFPGLTVVD